MRFITATLRRQLIAAFAAVSAIFLLALVIGWSSVGSIGDKVHSGASQLDTLASATGNARDLQGSEVRALLDPARATDHLADVATFESTVASLNKFAQSDNSRAALKKLDAAFSQFKTLDAQVIALARARRVAEGTKLADGTTNDAADAMVQAVAGASSAVSKDNSDSAASASSEARTLMLVLALIALVFATLITVGLARSLTGRIRRVLTGIGSLDEHCMAELTHGLQAIANGDLTQEVVPQTKQLETRGHDEVAELTTRFNGMVEKTQAGVEAYNTTRAKVAEMLHDIGRTSDELATASQQMAESSEEAGRAVGEIAHAVSSVAEGAEDQVRSISEARELTADVAAASKASADGAEETRGAAEQARAIAQEGALAVTEATEAMRAVRDSSEETTTAIRALGEKSQQIGGIVDTITGIAEQTNLLALNAAIEAARVGEQGRGFAVVAEEVRKLAEESQSAASTISELIQEIQRETDRTVTVVETGSERTAGGVETVERAKDAFMRISDAVEDMGGRVDQIATAIDQIASAGRSMEESITQVAAVAEQSSASSQQVSASTEETTASTERVATSASDLARTAEQLEELVRRFTLA
jgi:methyl-accepting chemotaxis protein